MATPNDEARIALVRKALEAAEKKAGVERARIPWRSGFHTSAVIELPVAAVLLNPKSHRIKAQLESDPQRDAVAANPFDEDAQTTIAELLRRTPDFERLRENLRDVKQRDYGIVSHAGLLINANTRCVALRDIGTEYIRVAVLPPDATSEEIDRIELQLQMQQDFRQAYTFSNELLFINDLLTVNGYTDEKVALEMHWASQGDVKSMKSGADDVQKCVRMLSIARELQHQSDGKLPLTWFDSNRQAMLELDNEVEKLKKQDPDAARALRNNRLLGMLADVGYRELRYVDQNFVGRYLTTTIEEQPLFQGRFEQIIAPTETEPAETLAGIDVFEASTSNPAELDVEPFLARVANSFNEKRIALIASEGQLVDEARALVMVQLKVAVEDAATEAKLAGRNDSLHDRPRKLLMEAAKTVRRATDAYQQVRANSSFDRAAFKKARADLNGPVDALDTLIKADESE